jgi:hypothetical protein
VAVGNAFHHFDADLAPREIRRVLRSAGALALFWARAEDDDPSLISVTREIDALVERVGCTSAFIDAYRSWYEPQAIEGFTTFERRSFPVTHAIPSNRVADLYATSSDIASLPADARGDLLARIAALTAGLPETIELAQRSDVMLSFRKEPGRPA